VNGELTFNFSNARLDNAQQFPTVVAANGGQIILQSGKLQLTIHSDDLQQCLAEFQQAMAMNQHRQQTQNTGAQSGQEA